MDRIRKKNIISLILNVSMAVIVAFAICWYFTDEGMKTGVGNMTVGGVNCFVFFTNDSNIFAALCSLIMIPFNVKSIRTGRNEIPKWAMILKFTGTTAVALTLVVVLAFLGPLMGYGVMFEGVCLCLHLICPLISLVSFCFFEQGTVFSRKTAILGIIPMFIYANVYLINVIFLENWIDFYCFNIGGCWYITYAIFPVITYLLALAICAIHNGTERRMT